jgi:hypothetical protein
MPDHRNQAITDVAWEDWPQALRDHGQQVLDAMRSGHPLTAVDVLDELISDLTERRRTMAEVANRRFEPSTDER